MLKSKLKEALFTSLEKLSWSLPQRYRGSIVSTGAAIETIPVVITPGTVWRLLTISLIADGYFYTADVMIQDKCTGAIYLMVGNLVPRNGQGVLTWNGLAYAQDMLSAHFKGTEALMNMYIDILYQEARWSK